MIIITGATGKTGSIIAETLIAQGHKVRVIGRDADNLKRFTSKGAEAAVGDIGDTAFAAKAFSGADAVYAMIPPNFTVPDLRAYQKKVGESMIAAIKKSSVKHVVHLSSQGAHLSSGTGPIVGLHDQGERLNKLDNANVLHLRPSYFMENLLMNIDMIKNMNILGSAMRGDVQFPMIATRDIGVYAAERLARRDFSGKSVRDLLGQRDLSLNEAAAIIGKKLGKPDLKYVAFPYDEAEKGMIAMGLTPDMSKLYVEMSKALNDGIYAAGLSRTNENTTPTTIEEFADVFAKIYVA